MLFRSSSFWILHLFLKEKLGADEVAAALRAEGIPFTARYVTPLYTWPVLSEARTYGQSRFPFDSPYTARSCDYAPGLCPVFEACREYLILLPVDEQWTTADAADIASALRKVIPAFAGRGSAYAH